MTPPLPAKPSPPKPRLEALRETARHTRRTLALVWASSRPMTFALAGLTLFGAVFPLGVAWVGKRIVDAVVARSSEAALHWVLVELGLVVGLAIVQRGLGLVRQLLGARLGIDINVAILEKAQALDLAHFEDSEFYDKLTRARREASSRPVALVTEAFGLVQSAITLAGYAALLVSFSALAVLGLLAATIPATLAEMRWSKLAFRVRNWRSPESRRLLYLEYVLANDEHAKEVKLFDLGPLLLGRYRELSEQFYAEDKGLAWKRAWITQALSFLATGAFYAAYASMAILAAAGKLTLGELTLYILAFRQGQQAFQSILGSLGAMYEHNLYMSNLFEYLDVAPVARGNGGLRANGEAGEREGIRFEDVGFRYPGKEAKEGKNGTNGKGTDAHTEGWALRHVSLTIRPGESLALVGENGAGKTTLIKLLTRLYEPTEGRITLDGRELREWDERALLARFGVVFQDFNQYQLTMRENVGVGSVEHLADEPRIERAVERGGARELVAQVGGLEASLGRWFKDGTELSGGQWQKVALARAFMREEADILVLDEPTAALDAEAEHAVFSRFRELAKGRTTIVISHRFPTVRMAQRIVVLDHGRVIEEGSHDALVAKHGRYARMFALQAEGYR